MRKIARYLNPIDRLGNGEYSFFFPFFANIILSVLSEFFAYQVAKDPMIVGVYIIFLNVAFIIYFAFRDGILGGTVSSFITIFYYFYIIYTRHYKGVQLSSAIDTTIMLGCIYLLLSLIIGWLKQTIDKLIGRETNEKIWLQTILQQLPVGVLITDAKGRVVQTNKQLEKIIGTDIPLGFRMGKDKGDIIGRNIFDSKVAKPAQSPLYQALKSNKPIVGKEFLIQRNDGEKIFIQINSSVIHNKKKKIVAAASIISDITLQKELEHQKDDFLSMASHELKTPITSLKMFIDLQKQQLKEKNPKKAGYFNERIHDQADRLKELTNDLLDVSRIQTNKLRFTIEEFNISDVIRDTVEGLRGTTDHHEILIKDGNNYQVKADRYRIYQVLVNLISNAIKYSPDGKKIIVNTKKDRNNIVVSVQDFGIGIDKAQQEKIFERLYQVTDSHEKTFPGLGLGLYISKEIIKRHKGSIWIKSTKGKGSTFFFSLPMYIPKK